MILFSNYVTVNKDTYIQSGHILVTRVSLNTKVNVYDMGIYFNFLISFLKLLTVTYIRQHGFRIKKGPMKQISKP